MAQLGGRHIASLMGKWCDGRLHTNADSDLARSAGEVKACKLVVFVLLVACLALGSTSMQLLWYIAWLRGLTCEKGTLTSLDLRARRHSGS